MGGGLGEGQEPWLSKLAARPCHCGQKRNPVKQTAGIVSGIVPNPAGLLDD